MKVMNYVDYFDGLTLVRCVCVCVSGAEQSGTGSLHSTLVESGVRSQPVYCADVYRERRYQMLCEYKLSSWRWAC
jgi:hypothetical protein